MPGRSRIVHAVHRALLRSARTPLARLWARAYRLAARAWTAYLVRGQRDPSAYLRGSVGTGDWLPGLADIDVALVLAPDPAGPGVARERAYARWQALRRRVPAADLLLDYPLILEEDELRAVAGRSVLTSGRAAYFGSEASVDKTRMLERPGLYGTAEDWSRFAGPERRPPEPARHAEERGVAAWLELVYWWQWAFPACVDASGPRTASLCVKLVAEPARIWLWLAHGERAGERADVLARALRRLPEEEAALRLALDLQPALADFPEPPLEEVLPTLARMSARIAGLLWARVEGTTEVRLAGQDPVLPHEPWFGPVDTPVWPLADWRSLVWAPRPDESFGVLAGEAGDPSAVAVAALAQSHGPYAVLRASDLMLFPSAVRSRTRLRAAHCPLTAPVAFALADARPAARFPDARGWSAGDTAARAVTEHRAWLRAHPAAAGGEALGRLLSAARAGLFLEDPGELAVTVAEAARRLADRSPGARTAAEEGLGHYREWAVQRTPPPRAVVAGLREAVLGLDAFRQPPRALPVEP